MVSHGSHRARVALGSFVAVALVFAFAAPAFSAKSGANLSTSGTQDPCNSFLAVQVAGDGTFNEGAAPDPTTCGAAADGSSWDLSYRWPSAPGTGYTTLRVDGADAKIGDGTQTVAPHDVNATTNEGSWQHGDVVVTQNLQLAQSTSGNVDTARIAYTVTNNGSAPHDVGVRAMIDDELNNNDGAAFRVPGIGAVTTEQTFTGSAIPQSFQAFFDLNDSTHVAQAILSGGDATPPDTLKLAAWPQIVGALWDYTTNSTTSISGTCSGRCDSAYAAYWNPQTLAPGASRTYVTYYGLGGLTTDTTPPLAVGVSSPATLTCQSNAYTPNPFAVVATVQNVGSGAATGVQASINLPTGLALASGAATQSLGDMAVNDQQQASWSLTASPQATDTSLSYSITVSATNAAPKTLTFHVALPACAGPTLQTLTVTKAGDGSGTVTSGPTGIDCGATCSATFTQGTGVALNATPDPGSTFIGWSGDCTGTAACNVTMDGDHAVTATFTKNAPTQQTLTVTKDGNGSGSVTSSPAGVDCGATCASSFDQGTSVTLTATADPGSTFNGWSGDCTGMTCTVTMDADHTITATFSQNAPPPECQPGNGFGDKNHCHNGPPGHDHSTIIIVFVFHAFCSHFFDWWDGLWSGGFGGMGW